MRGGSAQLAAPIDPADGLSPVQGPLATSFWVSRRRGPANRNVLATNNWEGLAGMPGPIGLTAVKDSDTSPQFKPSLMVG
jgi:hypothetical protein